MKTFYNSLEQGYAPRHSFFNGAMVPYPDLPARMRNLLTAIEGDGRFELQPPPAPEEAV